MTIIAHWICIRKDSVRPHAVLSDIFRSRDVKRGRGQALEVEAEAKFIEVEPQPTHVWQKVSPLQSSQKMASID